MEKWGEKSDAYFWNHYTRKVISQKARREMRSYFDCSNLVTQKQTQEASQLSHFYINSLIQVFYCKAGKWTQNPIKEKALLPNATNIILHLSYFSYPKKSVPHIHQPSHFKHFLYNYLPWLNLSNAHVLKNTNLFSELNYVVNSLPYMKACF